MMRRDHADEDRTPEELREDAKDCRQRAEQAAEVRDLASDASAALTALSEHEYLTDRATHQVDLLEQTLGHIRYGEAWGQDAHLLKDHAHRLETRADFIEADEAVQEEMEAGNGA